jgi:hypothetical protein
MLKHLKKYWLEYVFFILLLNAVLCAIGFVHEELPIEYHEIKKIENEWGEEPLDKYLDKVLGMKNCTVMMAGTELDENIISKEIYEKMKSVGIPVMEDWSQVRKNGLIVLWSNGEVIDAKCCEGSPISYGSYINQHYVLLEGYVYFGFASIYLDDVLYSVSDSGLNIIVFDEKKEIIIDSVNFDYVNGKMNIKR